MVKMIINHFIHVRLSRIFRRARKSWFDFNFFKENRMLHQISKRLLLTVGMSWMPANTTLATDNWSVGVSCEIEDIETGRITELSKTSFGPWVIVEGDLAREGERYALRVEASNRDGWGVIFLENQSTSDSRLVYGPVS